MLERNPYSVWVDSAGNQLPYIDRIRMTLGENLEVINLRAIAGEYDSQARHIDISKLPVLLENQQKGGYRVYLDPSDQGADVGLFCNQSFEKDPEIAKWLGTREFRIALSHGIDRQQVNETFVLGLGQTGSAAPGERTPYFPGPEYKTLHCAYDVKQANAMLDKLGLDKKDSEGYRLRAGRRRAAASPSPPISASFPFTQIAEMVVEQWKQIGIRGEVQEMERGLATARLRANEHQIYFETQWGADNMFGHSPFFFPIDGGDPGRSAVRDLVRERGDPGQEAAAAHARADGEVPQGLRRAGPGADAAGQGGLEDRARRDVGDPGGLELARLSGRAGDQEQHRATSRSGSGTARSATTRTSPTRRPGTSSRSPRSSPSRRAGGAGGWR